MKTILYRVRAVQKNLVVFESYVAATSPPEAIELARNAYIGLVGELVLDDEPEWGVKL